MDNDTELEDLLALIEHPGFKRFRDWAGEEYGSKAYRIKAQTIMNQHSKIGTMDKAGTHLLQLEASAAAVEGLFTRLNDRVNALRGKAKAATA